MKKRVVKDTLDFQQYPFGERQIGYDNWQFMFREPRRHWLQWDINTRNALVRLLRATQRPEAWEFVLKEQYGRPWYLVRVYHPNRRSSPIITMDSDSLNVFVAQCSFYCVGFRAKLMESVYGGEGIGEPNPEPPQEIVVVKEVVASEPEPVIKLPEPVVYFDDTKKFRCRVHKSWHTRKEVQANKHMETHMEIAANGTT